MRGLMALLRWYEGSMTDKPHKHGHGHDGHDHEHGAFGPLVLSRVMVAVCGAAVAWFDPPWPVWLIDGLAWAALAYAAWPIFSEAVSHLRQKRMTMELSMSIAVVAAASSGFGGRARERRGAGGTKRGGGGGAERGTGGRT